MYSYSYPSYNTRGISLSNLGAGGIIALIIAIIAGIVIYFIFAKKDRRDYSGKLLQLVAGRGVTAYLEAERSRRVSPAKIAEPYTEDDIYRLGALFGEDNVRIARKNLEDIWKLR